MSDVLYLYGFVPRDVSRPGSAPSGVDGAEVDVMDVGSFSAVVSRLPRGVYASDVLSERIKDLGWLAERGLAHERIVTWFVDHSTIVPARLLTIFSGPDSLRERADELRGEVERALDRFSEAREWDLKVSYEMDELVTHVGEVSGEVAQLDRQIAQARPGRRYLLQRRREELARRESAAAARRMAREILDLVREEAADVVELAAPDGVEELPVVLNAAVLVPRGAEQALRTNVSARSGELARLGVHVAFTGPWAPYRFAAGEADG